MEVRGLGIINVRELFGAASVCESKEIELIVDLIDWRPDLEFDRLGLDENTLQILETEYQEFKSRFALDETSHRLSKLQRETIS